MYDNTPYNIEVDAKVVMDQFVSDTSHPFPGDIWIFVSQLYREVLGGLTDDLQISNDGILGLYVCQELIVRHCIWFLIICLYSAYSFLNIF